jgi:rhomboid family GlyGly-CTERM serine protease
MIGFSIFSDWIFPWLSLERSTVNHGEVWRLLTSNLVHFGWAHTLMNLAAFAMVSFTLLDTFTPARYLFLLTFCSLCVSLGVYYWNPEYETYAGLSGSIHGLIVAGLLLNRRHALWVNGIFLAGIFFKIFHEHQDNYQTTELQDLLPVAVAYDAHLYGALAGLFFGVGYLIAEKLNFIRH